MWEEFDKKKLVGKVCKATFIYAVPSFIDTQDMEK